MHRAKSPLPILLLGLLLPVHGLRAQAGSMRVTFSSPTAASLGEFGDVPVNLHTGLPDISIPLFTVKGRTLELPIVLRYHGGGIRVEEIGGWVGMGWSLDAGGSITRTVRGLMDEGAFGYYSTGHTFYSGDNWQNPSATLIDNLVNESVDGEPDQFFYNFAGRSGEFAMGYTSTTEREVRPVPYQKIRIEPTITGDDVTSWEITAEDGTRYTFGEFDTNTDLSFNIGAGTTFPTHYGETFHSSWHLTKIHAPGGDSITLHYSSYTATHRLDGYVEQFDYRVGGVEGDCVPPKVEIFNEHQISTQRLDSIKSAVHTVRFTTDPVLRVDALDPDGNPQEVRLARITVTTPTGTTLRSFRLDHDYFPGTQPRLRLVNVYEEDPNGVALPPWTFTYDNQAFPPLTSKAQDHWGYWNGKNNSTLIPRTITQFGTVLSGADRSPDPITTKVGSLTRITYPTGGYSEFDWEAHDYGAIRNDTALFDLGTRQTASVVANDFDGFQTTTFTVGGANAALVEVNVDLLPPDCGTQIGCPFAEIVGEGTWQEPTQTVISLLPGTYTLRVYTEFSGALASIGVAWQDLQPTTAKLAGGLRIAEVRAADAMGDTITRRYSYRLQDSPARSSGVVDAEPRYHYEYNVPGCAYFSRSSQSRMPLGSGSPVTYREVTVLHGNTGEFGNTRETFRSFAVQPDGTLLYEKWPFSRVTSYGWKRGQRLEAAEYNGPGQVQQRVSTTYSFQDTEPTTSRRFRGISFNSFSAGQGGSNYVYNPFEVISAWVHPAADTTVVYDEAGGSSVSTVKTYRYGNPLHTQLSEVVETNSNGTQRITRMKYPADYVPAPGTTDPVAAAITAMQGDAHMHSQVIERWVVEDTGSGQEVVQAELTTFKIFPLGQILPFELFLLQPSVP